MQGAPHARRQLVQRAASPGREGAHPARIRKEFLPVICLTLTFPPSAGARCLQRARSAVDSRATLPRRAWSSLCGTCPAALPARAGCRGKERC